MPSGERMRAGECLGAIMNDERWRKWRGRDRESSGIGERGEQ